MLLFWSRAGKWTRSLFFFPFNGLDSLLLFWLALLYSPSPFYSTNYSKSNSLSPFCLSGKKNFKAKFLFSSRFGQKYSKSNFNSTKIFSGNSKSCLSCKIIPILQKFSKSHFFSDVEKFPLPTNSILLPPESKWCPLTLASALACADSVDELWFCNKNESWFAQRFIHSILLPLESKQCPLTLASVLACANSADGLRF